MRPDRRPAGRPGGAGQSASWPREGESGAGRGRRRPLEVGVAGRLHELRAARSGSGFSSGSACSALRAIHTTLQTPTVQIEGFLEMSMEPDK